MELFVGTDIVEVERIKRAISRSKRDFLQRVFTPAEINKINVASPNYERAAGFWAAKESMVKALGTGFREGIRFHDIEVEHNEYGCPRIVLHGRLKALLNKKGSAQISLTISHCRTYAIAVVAVVTHN
ncbi:holo-[acyl-carrier-protein] synthase [Mixta theicola]|nr:holo-[acyl-carrier-protein] synthase [Mixta theicola]